MSISRLASSITESPTLKLNETAAQLRAKGEPVIHLGIGEPKNKAPITALLGSAAKFESRRHQVRAHRWHSCRSKKRSSATPRRVYGRLVAPENM
jgi:aspartate aminotransferase